MATDTQVFGMMQTDQPFKQYIKTVPSKVYVSVLDPFNDRQPVGVILKGNPRKQDRDSIVEIWSEKEDAFFKRANRRLLETGVLIPHTPKEVVEPSEEERLNSMSDDELEELLSKRFIALQNIVNKITSPATMFRLLEIAKELDKPQKTVAFLEGKLSELQQE